MKKTFHFLADRRICLNLIFPVWFLFYLLPHVGMLIILAGNLIVDGLVLFLSLKFQKIRVSRSGFVRAWMKVWLFGFAADLLSALLAYLVVIVISFITNVMNVPVLDQFSGAIMYNVFDSMPAVIFVLILIGFAGWMIYVFNKKTALKKLPLTKTQLKRTALILAVFTAPYLFLLPASIMY